MRLLTIECEFYFDVPCWHEISNNIDFYASGLNKQMLSASVVTLRHFYGGSFFLKKFALHRKRSVSCLDIKQHCIIFVCEAYL